MWWRSLSLCSSRELSCSIKLSQFSAQGPYKFDAVNWRVPGLAATLHDHLLLIPALVWPADALVCDSALCYVCTLQQQSIIQGTASLLLPQNIFTNSFQGKGESASYGPCNFILLVLVGCFQVKTGLKYNMEELQLIVAVSDLKLRSVFYLKAVFLKAVVVEVFFMHSH